MAQSSKASPPTADWKSLPVDLIRGISERFLATDDLDFYMDFRAVCGDWRRATDDPRADGTNPRFLPSSWIMLERERSDLLDSYFVTFVNTRTRRFLRKSMTCLRRYFFVRSTATGLLVLGEREPPYETRVLNPFTGAIVHFKAPIPAQLVEDAVVTSSPMLVFLFTGAHKYCVSWADQRSECFQERELISDHPTDVPEVCLWNMTRFADHVYLASMYGSIISTSTFNKEGTMATTILGPAFQNGTSALEMKYGYYLLESDGDLLLVLRRMNCTGPVVYRVDTVNKVLVPVRSIGNRALFVGPYRCLSVVDARKFPTIAAGTIYYVTGFRASDYQDGGWKKKVGDISLMLYEGHRHPLTLAQVFADYCNAFEYSELELLLRQGCMIAHYSDMAIDEPIYGIAE